MRDRENNCVHTVTNRDAEEDDAEDAEHAAQHFARPGEVDLGPLSSEENGRVEHGVGDAAKSLPGTHVVLETPTKKKEAKTLPAKRVWMDKKACSIHSEASFVKKNMFTRVRRKRAQLGRKTSRAAVNERTAESTWNAVENPNTTVWARQGETSGSTA